MPRYGLEFLLCAVLAFVAWFFNRWAHRKLKRSGKDEFPFFRDGGIQAALFLSCGITAIILLAFGFADL